MLNIKEVSHFIAMKRRVFLFSLMDKSGLNMLELEILGYLYECPDRNTFTEIFRSKDYAKSHISTAVANLVNDGYIEKKSLPANKKVHNLIPLEKSKAVVEEYNECIEKFKEAAFKDIPGEEIELFHSVIDKIKKNLESK